MKNNQRGQSTIEFIFAFVFGVSIIFVVFKSAMNYAAGYVAHYANFMASRHYLTHDINGGSFGGGIAALSGADQAAKDAFTRYQLNVIGIPVSGFVVNAPDGDSARYLTVGTYVEFEQEMDVMGRIAGQNKLKMVSESFLGKEPTRVECASRTCYAIKGTPTCSLSDDITLFDDGC